MRKLWLVFLCLALTCAAVAQSTPAETQKSPASQLFFVLLNRPANAPTYSQEKLQEIQDGHMANIRRLGAEGKMKMAGPFLDDTKLRGIFVFSASTADEVKELLKSDPAVKAGRLEGDVHRWEPGLGEIHDATKLAPNAGMETFAMILYHWTEKAKSASKEEIGAAFAGHRKYQDRLFEEKLTEIGGPFGDAQSGPLIGVVIAHGKQADGEKLGNDDPVVQSGVARVEVHEWATVKGVLFH